MGRRALVGGMPSSPILSVVVSAYQAEAYVERSLNSVLDQDLRDLELIVVDDGSTDATAQILAALSVRDSRVRVIRQDNGGLTAALSRACAEARGEFIARHDADDISLPGRLSRQVAALQADTDLAFVSCWSRAVGPRDELLYEIERHLDPQAATMGIASGTDGPPGHGSVMMRAAAYRSVGGYREEFRYAQDWDLWLRLAHVGLLAYLPSFLYCFRVAESSISAHRRSQQLRLAALARRCHAARVRGWSEAEWLAEARRVSAEPAPRSGHQDPGSSYFIGKCLLDRRDRRCLAYLEQAWRERPMSWRTCAALLLAQRLRIWPAREVRT